MNRSIFIVIVDFLLLSLIAFARFDESEEEKQDPRAQAQTNAPAATAKQDLVDVLKLSLDEERLAREALNDQLARTQETLKSREETLADRDSRLRQTQENLNRKAEEARQLDTERAQLQQRLATNQISLAMLQEQYLATRTNLVAVQERFQATRANLATLQQQHEATQSNLVAVTQSYEATRSNLAAVTQSYETTRADLAKSQQQYALAWTNMTALQQQLASSSSNANQTKQQLEALQADLRRREQEVAQQQRQLQTLETGKRELEGERQRLSTQLQVAETEKRMTREQVDSLKTEVKVVREEKAQLQQQAARLADNVSALAENSEKLNEELRSNRTLAPNTIFADVNSNRITTVFQATRPGVFGQAVNKEEKARTILVSQGSQVFTLYHVEDTPLSFSAIGTQWERLTALLFCGAGLHALEQLTFLDRDPRVLVVPLDAAKARQWGCKIYPVAKEPYKFQEAILVGGAEGHYGECQFQIDPETPGYLKMKRDPLGRLVGKFQPSRGDLVFSKAGELLGVMANKEYCLMFEGLAASRRLELGQAIAGQKPAALLSQMYYQVANLPFRLQ